jgi:hypothetical protein
MTSFGRKIIKLTCNINQSTIVPSTLLILFSEMLKLSKRSSETLFLKENKDCDKIFENIICRNRIPKINSLFSKHVLKCRRYYGIQIKKIHNVLKFMKYACPFT